MAVGSRRLISGSPTINTWSDWEVDDKISFNFIVNSGIFDWSGGLKKTVIITVYNCLKAKSLPHQSHNMHDTLKNWQHGSFVGTPMGTSDYCLVSCVLRVEQSVKEYNIRSTVFLKLLMNWDNVRCSIRSFTWSTILKSAEWRHTQGCLACWQLRGNSLKFAWSRCESSTGIHIESLLWQSFPIYTMSEALRGYCPWGWGGATSQVWWSGYIGSDIWF